MIGNRRKGALLVRVAHSLQHCDRRRSLFVGIVIALCHSLSGLLLTAPIRVLLAALLVSPVRWNTKGLSTL